MLFILRILLTMAAEIELKAHVENSEVIKVLLEEKALYSYAFTKEDDYYFSALAKDNFPSGVRIRCENRMFADGTEKNLLFLTYKLKEVVDGIEINDEREFEIRPSSCQAPVECLASIGFREFLEKAGFSHGISKKKKGWSFSHDGMTIELVEVEGLGWFIELEILAGSKNNVEQEKKKLLGFLDILGISRSAIESRYYSQMLALQAD